MKTSHVLNNSFSFLNLFYNRMNKIVEIRRRILQSNLKSGRYIKMIKIAGRFAGRRPTWLCENGIIRRLEKARMVNLVRRYKKSDIKFDEQLLKAEKLMTANPIFKGDSRKLVAAAQRVLVKCKFPSKKFSRSSVEYAAEYQINTRSSSGFPLFKRKGHVLGELIEQCYNLEDNNSEIWHWPITRGFRLQQRKSGLKTRIMYPYPGAIILAEDTFIIPLVEHFIRKDTFYVIGRNGLQISGLLKNLLKRSKSITATDFSNFDQTVMNEVSIMAFAILRSQFKLSKQDAILFENIVSYFCTSMAVSKQKGYAPYAFIKTHGVPSGSGFTNMIDTLVHAIMLEYVSPGILDKCLLCGDDSIIDSQGYDISKIIAGLQGEFLMDININKTQTWKSPKSIEFLGFTWKNYVRMIDPELAINQCVWHTDFRSDLSLYDRELSRCASVLLNGANGKYFLFKLFPELQGILEQGIDVRFAYIYGAQPSGNILSPEETTSLSVETTVPSTNQSLQLHIDNGWKIR